MSAAAIAAIVVTGVLVAALAFYLLWVLVILRRLVDTLGKVTFGVGAIAHRLTPVAPALQEINTDLENVAVALEGLVDDVSPKSVQEVAS
jgi:hypothetical protein